jgi:hypothetical protein
MPLSRSFLPGTLLTLVLAVSPGSRPTTLAQNITPATPQATKPLIEARALAARYAGLGVDSTSRAEGISRSRTAKFGRPDNRKKGSLFPDEIVFATTFRQSQG